MNIYEEIEKLKSLQANHERFFTKKEFNLLQIYIALTKLKVGDLVYYIPFEGCDKSQYENGKVKDISMIETGNVRVVYHCADEWDKWMDYTSALTNIIQLRLGWI